MHLAPPGTNILDELEAAMASSQCLFDVLLERGECGEGSPPHALDVREGRDIVEDWNASRALTEAIWTALIHRVQQDPRHWREPAIWLMLPRLRAITSRLRRSWRTDSDDIRSDVIIGFIEAMRKADPNRHNLGSYLWWATHNHARHACRQLTRESASEDIELVAARRTTYSQETPTEPGRVDVAPSPSVVGVEGERLGSLAQRLGLRDRIRTRLAEGADAA